MAVVREEEWGRVGRGRGRREEEREEEEEEEEAEEAVEADDSRRFAR